MTQALADAYASGIADHPQDWHMLQRLWLADLPPRPEPGERARPLDGPRPDGSTDLPGTETT